MSGIYLGDREAIAYYTSCKDGVQNRIDKHAGDTSDLELLLEGYEDAITAVEKRIALETSD